MKLLALSLFTIIFSVNVLATNYYTSNKGNDNANGLTPEMAWATLDKLNAQNFNPGDSVFFKAGDKWRGALWINNSGTKGHNIYFGRYGSGKNPQLLGSEMAADWTLTNIAHVWQTASELENFSEDYYAGRLFFVMPDSIIYGEYKTYDAAFSNLTKNYDYTVNGTTHYVYSTKDPNTAFESVEVNQHERVVNLEYFQSYLEFNGIDILFGRRANFYSGYPAPAGKGASDLIFRNCYIGYTGAKGSGAAYGITCYHSNLLIENCTFSDNGRRSISINSYASGGNPGRRMENIIIRNNVFRRGYHTTSLDLSTMGVDGDTVDGVYFYNNYIDDSEIKEIGDWGGSNQIFIQAGDGASYMTNIYIVNNVFVQATWRNILLEGNRTHYIWNNTIIGHNPVITNSPWGNVGCGGADTIDYRNNILYDNLPDNDLENYGLHGYNSDTYFPHRDYNLYWQLYPKTDRCFTSTYSDGHNGYYTIDDWDQYLSDFPGWDHNSPTPQDPLFVDYNNFDFRLSSSSPAKYAGTVLPDVYVTDPFGHTENITKNDFAGNPRDAAHPSIGAYAYKTVNGVENESLKPADFALGQNYPNPFNPATTIGYQLAEGGIVKIEIFDILGRKVKILFDGYKSRGNHSVKFQADDLSAGIYFYKIISGKFSDVKKMVLIK